MNIAILGAGNVGGALGSAWAAKGHGIRFGVRDPRSAKATAVVQAIGAQASAHGNAEACAQAEVVLVATPWPETEAALGTCGDLARKIVIDATNPLRADLSGLAVGHDSSGAEKVAQWARGAAVFKAFNQTGANNMGNARGYAQPLVMFVAGDDATKKPVVLQLVRDAGFEAVDAGSLASARLLEPLAMLWIRLALQQGLGRDFGLALLRRGK